MMATLRSARLPLFWVVFGAGLALAVPQTCRAAAQKLDACKLIDPVAAGKILGTKLTPTPIESRIPGRAVSLCLYKGTPEHGGFMLLVAPLHVADLAREVAAEKKRIIVDSPPPGVKMTEPKVRDLTGLGDAAFLVTVGNFLQIHVFAHDLKIVVNRNVKPTPSAIAETKKLVALALKNL